MAHILYAIFKVAYPRSCMHILIVAEKLVQCEIVEDQFDRLSSSDVKGKDSLLRSKEREMGNNRMLIIYAF